MQISQTPLNFSETDRQVWSDLYMSFKSRVPQFACTQVLDGLNQLCFDENIECTAEVNARLKHLTGWQLEYINGLCSPTEFARLLKEQVYSIAQAVRVPREMDFAELPDLFHDMLGHLPILINPLFRDFLDEYAAVATQFIEQPNILEGLGRVYWYLVETSLVVENGKIKILGAAILTSKHETERALLERFQKRPFELERIAMTPFNPRTPQEEYWVLESFDDIKHITHDLRALAVYLQDESA